MKRRIDDLKLVEVIHPTSLDETRLKKGTMSLRSGTYYESGEIELSIGEIEPNKEDASCLFCQGRFSDDREGELWVLCLMCAKAPVSNSAVPCSQLAVLSHQWPQFDSSWRCKGLYPEMSRWPVIVPSMFSALSGMIPAKMTQS
ncbi:hypothetical protein PR048_027750 [Dryococelus australis]|uniref:Uncharacterized protein n=1 Tax=Dryococelus australis TaxID=614101 RepID=A0ABQ9GHD3_9NEOP|nr:hypothetical protein PR048_027750 [Dryococelus australis]